MAVSAPSSLLTRVRDLNTWTQARELCADEEDDEEPYEDNMKEEERLKMGGALAGLFGRMRCALEAGGNKHLLSLDYPHLSSSVQLLRSYLRRSCNIMNMST